MILILIGSGLIIVGLVMYFINKYDRQILKFFQKIFSQQQSEDKDEEAKENEEIQETSSDSDSASSTEKFEKLKSGSFVEFSPDPSEVIMEDHMVTANGLLSGFEYYEGNFTENGAESLFFILGDRKYLIIRFKDGNWVAFDEEIKLVGDSANEFTPYGLEFTQKGQIPGSCIFNWRGMTLSTYSVGYMKYRHLGGKSHLADQAMVKFMLARRQSDDAIFYLENVKVGADRVWFGKDLGYDLDNYLGLILPKK